MRSLEECKAEVFRRSRQRIARRRRLTVGVVSLAFCLTVLASLPSPKDRDGFEASVPEGAQIGSINSGDMSLQIRAGTQEWTVADREQAAALLRAIRDGFDTDGTTGGPPESVNGAGPVVITFIWEEGRTLTYWLSGDTLLDSSTGQTQTVSPEFQNILETIMKEGYP